MNRVSALVAVAAVVGLSGCSSSPATVTAPSKYTQTWATPYASTTCTDYTTRLTGAQRWAAAADMLTGARSNDGAKAMPSDELVTTFMGGVDTACVVPTMTITDVAVGVYLTERARFQPTP